MDSADYSFMVLLEVLTEYDGDIGKESGSQQEMLSKEFSFQNHSSPNHNWTILSTEAFD